MSVEAQIEAGSTRYEPQRIMEATAEIQRWAEERLDILVPAKTIRVAEDGTMYTETSNKMFRVDRRLFGSWDEAEKYADELSDAGVPIMGSITVVDKSNRVVLSQRARTQLINRLDGPVRYFNKQAGKGKDYTAAMWRHIQDLLNLSDKKFLLRTLDNSVKSVLSSSYRVIDSHAILSLALRKLQEHEATVMHVKVFDDSFQVVACNHNMMIRLADMFKGKPGHTFVEAPDGDPHFATLAFGNSEGGDGTAYVRMGAWRKVCNNSAVLSSAICELRHVGADLATKVADSLVLSAATRNKIADAEISKIGDAIAACFEEGRFRDLMTKIAAAKEDVMSETQCEDACKALIVTSRLPKDSLTALMTNLLLSRDLTRFGLAQTATSYAHKVDDATAYELEHAGGKILTELDGKFDRWISSNAKLYDKSEDMEEELAIL